VEKRMMDGALFNGDHCIEQLGTKKRRSGGNLRDE
jgi:hypothetical protein